MRGFKHRIFFSLFASNGNLHSAWDRWVDWCWCKLAFKENQVTCISVIKYKTQRCNFFFFYRRINFGWIYIQRRIDVTFHSICCECIITWWYCLSLLLFVPLVACGSGAQSVVRWTRVTKVRGFFFLTLLDTLGSMLRTYFVIMRKYENTCRNTFRTDYVCQIVASVWRIATGWIFLLVRNIWLICYWRRVHAE